MGAIRIKRRSSTGSTGAPATLLNAELAYNEADNTLYYGYGDNGSGSATSVVSIAGQGAYATLNTAQTVTGDKVFSGNLTFTGSVDSNAYNTQVATTGWVQNRILSSAYSLPAATTSTLGGVIVGDNLTITANGVLSGVNSYTLPAATNSTLGGVIIPDGGNLTVDSSGNLTVTDGAFMPYPNYNGTNLAAIPFVGTGLADTSNTACSVAIGLIPNYSNYKIYGAFTNYNNTLQINGLTDIYSGGQLSPALAAGNAANGTGGIYAVPGDCRLININPQTSASVVNKAYVDNKVTTLPYLNNSTTNSTLTYSEGVISGFHYSSIVRKATGANSTNSERVEWLSNTGKFGNIQWTLKPNTGIYNWTWGGLSLDANTTDATRPEMSLSTNYSLDFGAGNAYGRGIGISTRDIYMKETYFSGPSLPAKEWTDNSFLIRSYADSRYLQSTGTGSIGDLTVTGNLTVQGTTTTLNTDTLVVEDKNIVIANVTSPTDTTADGGGLTLLGATNKTFNWYDATDAWTSSEHFDLISGKEYRINNASVLTATSLGSSVVSSSLTSVGTISSGTWQGTAIGVAYGGTGATAITGIVKGNGASPMTAATAGTDYLAPDSTIDGGTF